MYRMLLLALAALPALASAEDIVGLSGGNLIKFDSAVPGSVTVLPITGYDSNFSAIAAYSSGRSFIGMASYYDRFGSIARFWTINPDTGQAKLNHNGYFAFETTDLNVGLAQIPKGSNTGYFRGIAADGKHSVTNEFGGGGVESSQFLKFVAGDVNETETPRVHAIAYQNLDPEAASDATLFGIDVPKAILVRIGSVNGSPDKAASGKTTTIGSLGVTLAANSTANFDISTATGDAFATLTTAEGTGFYRINLVTGAATRVGLIGDGTIALSGMTIIPPAPTAPPSGGSSGGSTNGDPAGGGGGVFGAGFFLGLVGLFRSRRRTRLWAARTHLSGGVTF